MINPASTNRITGRFNVAVFVFCAVLGIFSFLLHSDKAKDVPVEGLVLSIGLDAMRYLVVVLVSALIVRAFWDRFVSDIFSLRAINYQEAIAIVLMSSVLFGIYP